MVALLGTYHSDDEDSTTLFSTLLNTHFIRFPCVSKDFARLTRSPQHLLSLSRMTITDQESSASATKEALLATSAADLQHGAGNIETEQKRTASTGEILTGKQEHCNYIPPWYSVSRFPLHFAAYVLADTLSTT